MYTITIYYLSIRYFLKYIYIVYNACSCLNVFCFCDESQILAQWQLLQQAKIKRCSIAPQNETPETVEVKEQLVALEAWHPIRSTMIFRLCLTKSINSYSYKLFEIRSHLALPSFAPPSWGKVLVCLVVKPQTCNCNFHPSTKRAVLHLLVAVAMAISCSCSTSVGTPREWVWWGRLEERCLVKRLRCADSTLCVCVCTSCIILPRKNQVSWITPEKITMPFIQRPLPA